MQNDNSEMLGVLQSETATMGEKLFAVSENLSSLFHYNFENNIATQEQQYEALIFSCMWTLKLLAQRKSAYFKTVNTAFNKILVEKANPNLMKKICNTVEGFEFFKRRFRFYVEESISMRSEHYDFQRITTMIYIAPLSSSVNTPSLRLDPITALKLTGMFSLAIKNFDSAVTKILDLLED